MVKKVTALVHTYGGDYILKNGWTPIQCCNICFLVPAKIEIFQCPYCASSYRKETSQTDNGVNNDNR